MSTAIEASGQQPDGARERDAVALSVILPAYNEATNLIGLFPDLLDVCDDLHRECEVIIVDDGSTDGTLERARHAAALYDEVRAIGLQANYGQSAALDAGFEAARGEVIVPMDADGQNDPADIPALLDRLGEGYDCVSGWRKDRDDPLSKRVPSRIQTRLAKLTGPDINDFGCTLTAYRADAVDELSLRGEQHRYIPAQLYELGYDVTELEVNHRPRKHGSSHYGVGRLLRGFVDLLYHLFRARYSTRPIHIFGSVGLLIMLAGMGLGSALLVAKYGFGASLSNMLPKLLLSVTLSLFGFGLFALGLLSELLTEILYADEKPYRIDAIFE